ncbi:MAG TPA: purine-nucleoside phosphorylase [Polyangia bacterium]|nr:purine-nucleoside phosphorylase [Polyangia bacterium]
MERGVADVRAAIGERRPRVGLILGSGLGGFADTLDDRVEVPFERITGLVPATIVGHAGVVAFGRAGALPVAAFKGRIHFYEGHDLARVAFPARLLVALGCKTLILTNAAGGIDPSLAPGEIVILRDHLNLLGGSPLRGPNDDSLGPRFPDMSEVYARPLRQIAADAGAEVGLTLRQGVYAACPGPNYETPSEVRMLRTLGADLVGMSTVPEAIAARHLGARVLGLSCVTNLAAGITDQPLSHDEVTETAARVRDQFQALLAAILARLAKEAS